MKRRMNRSQLEEKRRQWERMKRRAERGPRIVRWDDIPDGDEILIAVKPDGLNDALAALAERGVKGVSLGALEKFCGRADHQ